MASKSREERKLAIPHNNKQYARQRLQRISRSLEANSDTYLRPVQTSEPPYLHVCTPAAHLQTSMPLRLHASQAPELLRQAPTRPQHAPELLRQAPTARLRSSGAPHLHAYSTPLPHLRYSYIAPLRASDHHASIPPHRYAYAKPLVLYTSVPPRRYTCSAARSFRALCLHPHRANRPPYLHISISPSTISSTTSMRATSTSTIKREEKEKRRAQQ